LSRKRSLAGKPQSRSGSPSLKVSCCGAGSEAEELRKKWHAALIEY